MNTTFNVFFVIMFVVGVITTFSLFTMCLVYIGG